MSPLKLISQTKANYVADTTAGIAAGRASREYGIGTVHLIQMVDMAEALANELIMRGYVFKDQP